MLRLDLERELGCSPARAWPLIADPVLVNRWSTAQVESLAAGDGGHPGGTGAIRRVITSRRPRANLLEIIERADAPRRLDYRVIAGAPIRHHAGSIHLLEAPRGCLLRWEIEIDFVAPGMAWVMKKTIAPELDASLDRLVSLAADPPNGLPPPPARALDDSHDVLLALHDEADRIIGAQRAIADRLLHRGDDRGHFARALQYVTEDLTAMVANERFDHPGWVLRLIPIVHRFYEDSLVRRLGERTGAIEPHWERAFVATEKARERGKTAFEAALTGVIEGVKAHVEHDLPRALAAVYREYGERCDYARFLPDFLRTTGILADAGERVIADWPRRAWTPRARLLDALTPSVFRARMLDRTLYPIGRAYRDAFDRGRALISSR
ncbi:MAG TPA: DUF5995 family protein [Kofleriaceae bacterium]|nr:DUF5995 family protein [Kofleriaceae bacterium]